MARRAWLGNVAYRKQRVLVRSFVKRHRFSRRRQSAIWRRCYGSSCIGPAAQRLLQLNWKCCLRPLAATPDGHQRLYCVRLDTASPLCVRLGTVWRHHRRLIIRLQRLTTLTNRPLAVSCYCAFYRPVTTLNARMRQPTMWFFNYRGRYGTFLPPADGAAHASGASSQSSSRSECHFRVLNVRQ